jgi:acylphosphatase
VRNNDDGSVEAWFEGDPDDVDVMVHFAGIGPSGAYVDRVDVDEVEPEELRGFEVR